MKTPYYVFDADVLLERLQAVREALPGIPVTFSIKANSFVTGIMGEHADHLEVCSPGELEICRKLRIPPERIIYSGVMKEPEDIDAAIQLGAGILTAESPEHFQMIREAAGRRAQKVQVLLRLSSGNQFGMEREQILSILKTGDREEWVTLLGFHYYSGTQKKKAAQVSHDLDQLRDLIRTAREACGYNPGLVEYGPGLAVEYFKGDLSAQDRLFLEEAVPLLKAFAAEAPLGLEFGRFLAAPCGTYHTAVREIKMTEGVRYAILDGGIHHVKYYGQMMSLHQPPVRCEDSLKGETAAYCLCGSLCTVSDVLAHEIMLPELHAGDVLTFEKCGAYSATEAPALFLSRDLPAVYLRRDGRLTLVRKPIPAWEINCPDPDTDDKE